MPYVLPASTLIKSNSVQLKQVMEKKLRGFHLPRENVFAFTLDASGELVCYWLGRKTCEHMRKNVVEMVKKSQFFLNFF